MSVISHDIKPSTKWTDFQRLLNYFIGKTGVEKMRGDIMSIAASRSSRDPSARFSVIHAVPRCRGVHRILQELTRGILCSLSLRGVNGGTGFQPVY